MRIGRGRSASVERIAFGAGVVIAMVCAHAAAWTSASSPITEAIHQRAIDNALGSLMSPADRLVLKDQQSLVDQDQQASQSYEHSMTGITAAGQDEAVERRIYITLAEKLIRSNLQSAIDARKSGNTSAALPPLGKALHALQDATSPSHQRFQTWSYNEGLIGSAVHVFRERAYPNDSSKDLYQSHLEGVVRYAYDIYMERQPVPAQFFDTGDGHLLVSIPYVSPK